jgi:glycosyltransferase involved in cell wall biosynthesis
MAARDEVDDIAEAVRSRLADGYPKLQVILVDDRSTDGTGEAALEAAAGDQRFTLVRINELPAGWLGKVHAMREGVARATGEWLLMSDADVVVEPGTLKKTVAYAQHVGLDLLALVPSFVADDFFIDGVWVVFMRGLIVMADPSRIRDPKSKVALGAGAYNLVRRSAYDRTQGFEHLRMETGDDVALASMVKQSGGRLDIVDGAGHARVAIYRSAAELMRGIEKNGSTTATLPFPLFVLLFVALGSLLYAPFFAMALGSPLVQLAGLATFLVYTASEMYGLWRNTRMWLPAIIWPAAFAVMAAGMIRSTWLAHRNGGVYWRETFYSLDELAEGRRFQI